MNKHNNMLIDIQNSMSKPKIDYYFPEHKLNKCPIINYNDFADKYPNNNWTYCWQSLIVLIPLFYISFIETKNALQRSSICIYTYMSININKFIYRFEYVWCVCWLLDTWKMKLIIAAGATHTFTIQRIRLCYMLVTWW